MRKNTLPKLAISVAIALAAPFPSKVRYAPVARGFWAYFFEEGGDVGMGYVLAGSVLYLVVYSAMAYGLLTLGQRILNRGHGSSTERR